MLSGTNTAVVRVRERRELLAEACRLATGVGGYAAAVVSLIEPGTRTARPTVWAGADDRRMQRLSFAIADSPERDTSVTGRVLRSAAPFACNDLQSLEPELPESRRSLAEDGYQSIVALPLLVDKTAVGVFSLMSSERGVFSEEELGMLRELAANLSFALQYQHKEEEIRFLSYFDPLTGLAKRSLFCERLARRLEPRVRRRGDPAVAIFDIEQLSTINDSFGRHAGDLLLQRIADRMKSHFDATDGLAHLGGGTFGIALELEGGEEEVFGQLHEEVAAIVSRPFSIEGRDIPVEVKSGFARFPQNGSDASVLVQNAEAALRAAKTSGEKYLHHRLEMSSAVVSRLNLEHRLRGAIERQEFELHYQPKVSVTTRRIVGVEALLRWRDPIAGLVAPGQFLTVLESTGMIVQLGEWILRQAALDVQRWRSAQLPPVRVAVNISPVQLRRRAFT
ncbi:MAG: diguanylate cyclase domain-containing protein, partial [Steroidobacteraceae bacterium]